MIFYTYAPIAATEVVLLPSLQEYLAMATPANAAARRAALALLQSLGARTALPTSFPIRTDAEGRPYFDAAGAPDFNLSHSGNLVACALGTGRVGIDVQEETETIAAAKLAARFFGPAEKETLKTAPRSHFFAIWTQKEALGKYLGTGLAPLLQKDTQRIAAELHVTLLTERLQIGDRTYSLTVCSEEPAVFSAQ